MTQPNSSYTKPSLVVETTYWGRYLHTVGRVLSAAELLLAAAKQHRADSTSRADELVQIAERLVEIGDGLRAELEAHQYTQSRIQGGF